MVSLLHSRDAFTEAYVQSEMSKRGHHIKTILDNFYMKPSMKKTFVELTYEALELTKGSVEANLKAIEQQTGILRGWNLPDRECDLIATSNII